MINALERTLGDQSLKAIIVELNGSGFRYGYDEKNIHDKLVAHRFQPYEYEPFSRHLSVSAGYGSHNTLYLRDISFVRYRLEKAKKVKVFNESF